MTAGRSVTVDGTLRRSARRTPERRAIDYGDRSWTYAELDDAVSRAARVLRDAGLSRGDRVGALGHNSDAYLIAFLACARAGLVHVPINQNLIGDDLSYIVEQSGCALVLVDPSLAGNLPAGVRVLALRDADDACSYGSPAPSRTTERSRGARTWCSSSTPPGPPRFPRER